jgi:hypothetical protein
MNEKGHGRPFFYGNPKAIAQSGIPALRSDAAHFSMVSLLRRIHARCYGNSLLCKGDDSSMEVSDQCRAG